MRFKTVEVARLAEVSLRQLQLWEEKRIAIASRSGRVRSYTISHALYVIAIAEFRRRGLSFQRIRVISVPLWQLLDGLALPPERPDTLDAFILSDGRKVQFADSQNKALELVSSFYSTVGVCRHAARSIVGH
jgi:hypothetical protein